MRLAVISILVLVFGLLVNERAQAQWNDEEPIEEIITYGERDFSGFSSIFGLWDFTGMFADNWLNELNAVLEAVEAAQEQVCNQQIEQWRQDCHTQMNVAYAGCGLSGVLMLGSAIRYALPEWLRPSAAPIGATGLGLSCTAWNQAAHAHCDAIADSDRAPQVAQCVTAP